MSTPLQQKDLCDPIVRRTQLAKELDVSRTTLWNWIRLGIIPPPTRIGPRTEGWRRSVVEKIKDGRK